MAFGFQIDVRVEGNMLWEGVTEDDGCNRERLWAGWPKRLLSTTDFLGWIRRVPEVEQFLHDDVGWDPNTGGAGHVTWHMAQHIDQLPTGRTVGDKDRLRWLKYWARRAREEYDRDAILLVSGT